MNSFRDFELLPTLLDTLKVKKISKPTEIQANAIPMLMSGQSVVGVSETGSGKTLTYALPILHMIKSLENNKDGVTEDSSPRAVVMVPSRELGEQVSKVFKDFTHLTRLRVRPALGGMEFEQARRNVTGPFEVLLATPGRLIQLIDKKLINLKDVRMIVFDEADQMLDEGFLPNSRRIAGACPEDVQLALFSATISTNVQALINMLFEKAEVIKSSQSGKTVKTLITQNRLVVDGKRWPVFEFVLKQKVDGGTIIFTNTREQCDALAEEMTEKGYPNVVYRGEMDKTERRANLRAFRKGEIGFLISTDLAARGLDVEHVGRVVNYHLPQLMENYLHRAGRTARAGRVGVVVNLVTERDERLISRVEGKKVEVPRTIREKMTPEQQSMKQQQQNEQRAQQQAEREAKSDGTGRKPTRQKAQLFEKSQEKTFKFAKKVTRPKRSGPAKRSGAPKKSGPLKRRK